ncbi:MAG TPA: ribonuclease P protein component [Sphaerochaeta sp.]|nr:ribonuclease P protein component [Sphaerochaeta sp.]
MRRSHTLTKREIVKRKRDIATIFSTGSRFAGRTMKLVVCQNSLEYSRVIVIPVRNYGNSVSRNRIRRQIKEIWRTEKHAMLPGYDVAFVVYPGKKIDHTFQRKHVIDLCQKAGLYPKP